MKRNTGLIFIFLFLSCQQHRTSNKELVQSETLKSVSNYSDSNESVKSGANAILFPNGSDDIGRFYDTVVNDLIIFDAASIEKKFGRKIRIYDTDKKTSLDGWHTFEGFQVVNSDRTQFLTLQVCYGGGRNEFCDFRVEKLDSNYDFLFEPLQVKEKEFITGRGIKLDMTPGEVVHLFRKPTEVSNENGFLKYSYQQKGGLYFGDYYFLHGRLEKFRFGNVNP